MKFYQSQPLEVSFWSQFEFPLVTFMMAHNGPCLLVFMTSCGPLHYYIKVGLTVEYGRSSAEALKMLGRKRCCGFFALSLMTGCHVVTTLARVSSYSRLNSFQSVMWLLSYLKHLVILYNIQKKENSPAEHNSPHEFFSSPPSLCSKHSMLFSDRCTHARHSLLRPPPHLASSCSFFSYRPPPPASLAAPHSSCSPGAC